MKLSLLLSIVLLILGSTYAQMQTTVRGPIRNAMVLNSDSQRLPRKGYCKAMKPSCIGQEAYDRWISSLATRTLPAPLDDDEQQVATTTVVKKPQKKRLLSNKKRIFKKLPRYRCMAMTPGCMGQEAYDRWINSRKAAVVATTASLDDNGAPVIEKKNKRKFKIRVCKAISPSCMGQKAYDAYMERFHASRATPASLSDFTLGQMVNQQIRCKALTPFCMGQKAYDQFLAKLL